MPRGAAPPPRSRQDIVDLFEGGDFTSDGLESPHMAAKAGQRPFGATRRISAPRRALMRSLSLP